MPAPPRTALGSVSPLRTGRRAEDCEDPVGGVLAPGELVADRYRVLRLLGAGGMGEVYEVYDQDLDARVALKAISGDLAGRPGQVHRFKNEILLARSLTHRNICRVFDFGVHTRPGAAIPFLTMELLPGCTLSQRLAESGPLGEGETLALLRQLVAALDAAHAAGIVHRDFKSSNVLLVPEPSGLRAVVTDFGLAGRARADDDPARGAALWCTPAYASPEQLLGRPTTAAADIYSLGMVLFEMVTGRLPFDEEDTCGPALQRLWRPAPSPRAFAPRLGRRWEAAIGRCLAQDPRARFPSAQDLLRAVDRGSAASGSRPAIARSRRRGLWAVGLALVLVLGAAAAWQSARVARSAAVAGPGRRAIAVLGFQSQSDQPQDAWMSTALSTFLGAALTSGADVTTVRRENVAGMMRELRLPAAADIPVEVSLRLRRALGADLLVVGSYSIGGSGAARSVCILARIKEARTARTLAEIEETGAEADLLALLERLGGRLRQKLGLPAPTAAEAQALRAILPTHSPSLRRYAEGLGHFERAEYARARDALGEVTAREPGYPGAHEALAEVLFLLGYDAKASAEAQQAVDLSFRLGRRDRLWLEAERYRMGRQWNRAVEAYRALWTFAPQCGECALRLAETLSRGGRGREGLEALDALRAQVALGPDDARVDLDEASIAAELSDFSRAEQAAQRALAKSNAVGAPLLAAQAREIEARLALDRGEMGRAADLFRDVERIYRDQGDELGRTNALNGLASVFRNQGDLAAAARAYEEILLEWRRMEFARGIGTATNNLGLVYNDAGDLAASKRSFEQALAVYEQTGDRSHASSTLLNLSLPLVRLGELGAARRALEQSRVLARAVGNRRFEALATGNLGQVEMVAGSPEQAIALIDPSIQALRQLGDLRNMTENLVLRGQVLLVLGRLPDARRAFEETLALAGQKSWPSKRADALAGLGLVALAEGRLLDARRLQEEALAYRRAKEPGAVAESELALVETHLALGRPARAESLARQALAHLPSAQADLRASAHYLLARCLLGEGRLTAAGAALRSGLLLAARSESASLRFDGAIVSARMDLATHRADRARARIEEILPELRLRQLAPREREALLLRARAQAAPGERARGRMSLDSLARNRSPS